MHGEKSPDEFYPGDMVMKTYFSDQTANYYIVIKKINTEQYMCFDMDDGHIGPILLNTTGLKYTKVHKLA